MKKDKQNGRKVSISKCLTVRHISRELTGSSDKVRADFVPLRFVKTIEDCSKAVEAIIDRDRGLTNEQFKQRERMGI